MPGAAHMCVAESHYGIVGVLVTGAIFIHIVLIYTVYIMRYGIGVGTELHYSHRHAGTGKRMPHAVCPYHGIHIFGLCGDNERDESGRRGHGKLFHIYLIRLVVVGNFSKLFYLPAR